jgi:hypothetical protein
VVEASKLQHETEASEETSADGREAVGLTEADCRCADTSTARACGLGSSAAGATECVEASGCCSAVCAACTARGRSRR